MNEVEAMKYIYLDYHATTPCDPRVVEAMLPYFTSNFANPSSSLHFLGRRAAQAVEDSRGKVADLIEACASEIIFTSGATESNNLAIFGAVRAHKGQRRKIVTSPIEHKSVLEACRELSRQGFELTLLPVNHDGTIKVENAERLIDEKTLLVSVHAANNEIGTLQPISKIATLARDMGALIHCDAAQAVGKIPVNASEMGIDFLSISAHKLYGPKGVGALYVRNGPKRAPLVSLAWGGGQEQNLRSGTYNVPGIVGFGQACEVCKEEMPSESKRITELRNSFEKILTDSILEIQINGNLGCRLPGNSSLSLPNVEGDALLLNIPNVAMSIGSACNTGALEPSYVLTSIGLSREMASSTIRVGIGRFTTYEEIKNAATLITEAYDRLAK
jgi:cysteine desulfurase